MFISFILRSLTFDSELSVSSSETLEEIFVRLLGFLRRIIKEQSSSFALCLISLLSRRQSPNGRETSYMFFSISKWWGKNIYTKRNGKITRFWEAFLTEPCMRAKVKFTFQSDVSKGNPSFSNRNLPIFS